MKELSWKQKTSKSPLYGYRKPIKDEFGNTWCNCTQPTLVSHMGLMKGAAQCLRCMQAWYN